MEQAKEFIIHECKPQFNESIKTKKMRYLINRIFQDLGKDLQFGNEVKVPHTKSNRVDIGGFYKRGKNSYSFGIELKQSKTDLYNFGHNYCFNYNFICVPTELVGETMRYLHEFDFDYVGVLEFKENKKSIDLLPVRHAEINEKNWVVTSDYLFELLSYKSIKPPF